MAVGRSLWTLYLGYSGWHSGKVVWGFPSGSAVKIPPAVQDTQVHSLGGEDTLEEGMATHSSILAWKTP